MKKFLALLALACISDAYAQNIVFSNDQKGGGSKESFSSNEYIYGKADLGGKTAKEFFKFPDKWNAPYPYLYYVVEIYKGEEFVAQNNWNIALLSPGDEKQTSWDFDVLPDPAKATTVLSGTQAFDAGLASAPLYGLIQREFFKQGGTYNIRVRIYNRSADAYGNEQLPDKWPVVSGSFNFVFSESDIPALLKNADAAAATAKGKAFKK